MSRSDVSTTSSREEPGPDGWMVTGSAVRIGCPHVGRHLGPALHLQPLLVLPVLRQVEGHRGLPGQAPHDRIGPVPGHQVAPVLLHPLHAHQRQVVAPAGHDARDQPAPDEVVQSQIGVVEVGRLDRVERLVPRVARLVHLARVAPPHVRVEAGDRLYHGEALTDAVGCQRLEVPRPSKPLAQAHPPGVGEPEEGCAVRVLEVPPALADTERPMEHQRVPATVRHHLDRSLPAVEVGVRWVGAFGGATCECPPWARRTGRARCSPPTRRPVPGAPRRPGR